MMARTILMSQSATTSLKRRSLRRDEPTVSIYDEPQVILMGPYDNRRRQQQQKDMQRAVAAAAHVPTSNRTTLL